MDSNLLHTFLEVASTRHFGKAASNLYITQSTVSARIQQLEEQLDARLFERNTKQVALTSEGEKFLRHAESILMAWASARQDLAGESESRNTIRIASSEALWHELFEYPLPALLAEQNLFLQAFTCAANDLHTRLFNNEIDLALAYAPIKQNGWKSTALGTLELVLASANQSVGMDFSNETYIHVDWGDDFNLFVSRKFPRGLNPVLHTDNLLLAKSLMFELNACAYLPALQVNSNRKFTCFDSKHAPIFKRKIYACYSESSPQRKAIEKLLPYFLLKVKAV